jgi:membrane protease YdiL (CAAX protease family)
MPPADGMEEREELLAWIDSLLATTAGTVQLAVVVGLFIGALALSVFLLVQLGRRARSVSLPAPAWKGADVLACLLGWISTLAFTSLASSLVTPLGPGIEDTIRIVCQGFGCLALTGALLALPRTRGQSIIALGIGSGSVARGIAQGITVWACALPGLFATLLGTNALLLLLGVEPDPQSMVEYYQESVAGERFDLAFAIVGFGVMIAPLFEELLFRAILYRWLAGRFGIAAGAIISGLVFGLVHFSIFAFLPIALLGIVLALVLERTGNLWSCIALHAVFNAGQFALMLVVGSAGG